MTQPVPTMLQDPREIVRVSFGPTMDSPAFAVGFSGVTAIRAYQEDGDLRPWLAVYVLGNLAERLPATMVIISYQTPQA